ncbi:MAG: anaerobic ribonucleoside-triphosphate reductase activating protein [Lachnospiraceae bacterium]|nr:anaerobic ribonucleoside-triphosphate reductase activating protein [Lachnospiraceae bacterium]
MMYHNITKDDMLNGEGLRVVLWLSGCDHRCEGCHNPLTWDPDEGLVFDDEAKNEVFSYLSRDYISGLTLSGGDPLYVNNIDEVTGFCQVVKDRFPEKTIWLYTGNTFENIKKLDVMKYIDVCVDGEFVKSLHDNNLLWKGSSNQRVIDVKKTFMQGGNEPVLYCGDYE